MAFVFRRIRRSRDRKERGGKRWRGGGGEEGVRGGGQGPGAGGGGGMSKRRPFEDIRCSTISGIAMAQGSQKAGRQREALPPIAAGSDTGPIRRTAATERSARGTVVILTELMKPALLHASEGRPADGENSPADASRKSISFERQSGGSSIGIYAAIAQPALVCFHVFVAQRCRSCSKHATAWSLDRRATRLRNARSVDQQRASSHAAGCIPGKGCDSCSAQYHQHLPLELLWRHTAASWAATALDPLCANLACSSAISSAVGGLPSEITPGLQSDCARRAPML